MRARACAAGQRTRCHRRCQFTLPAKIGPRTQLTPQRRCSWYGLTRLPLALDKLRQTAARCEEAGTDADAAGGSSGDDEAGGGDGGGRSESRKDKSLGLLSQRFLQLFLTADSSVLSLEEAAQLLLGAEAGDAAKLKTKVRRLYDIANVLVSLQLIEKVHVDSRKPVFRWIGAAGGADPVATPLEAIPPPLAAPAKRAAAPSQAAQRKQPRRERAGAGTFAAPPATAEAPAAAQARRRRAATMPAAEEPASQDAANAPAAGTAPHTAYCYTSPALHSTFALYSQAVAGIVGAAAAEHRT